MKSKRGQFFLIMAVAIGALLLGATALFNQAETQDVALQRFNLACENYYYEVQELNKDFIVSSSAARTDFNLELQDFTHHFLGQNPGIEIVYLYGNNETGVWVYIDGEVEIQNPNQQSILSVENREFTFHSYNEFHFVMKQVKGLEVYFCEK